MLKGPRSAEAYQQNATKQQSRWWWLGSAGTWGSDAVSLTEELEGLLAPRVDVGLLDSGEKLSVVHGLGLLASYFAMRNGDGGG